jgi:hypothetical protein
MKTEKLFLMGRGLTCFHKSVISYILFALFLQVLGSILRSFFAPLALLEGEKKLPIIQFADRYRLLVYSIADFSASIPLLYLFYTQSMLYKLKNNPAAASGVKGKLSREQQDSYKNLNALIASDA